MSPDGIANLPHERGNVPRPRGRVTRHKAKDTSWSHSPDTAERVEDPTPTLVFNYVRPLLTQDTTMTDIRRKIGHEKGKAWTTLLNRLVDRIIKLRNQHVVAKDLYATLLKEHRTSWDL